MLEQEYIKNTSIKHRKEYGQFFTPEPVARLMVQWVLKDNPQKLLDPAFGLGIFYDQFFKKSSNQKIDFIACEFDKKIIDFLGYHYEKNLLKLIQCDYLENNLGKFDAIICNPPYMRFQNFIKRHDVLPKIESLLGQKLIGYANISSVFLIKALSELNPDGRPAFIMPFEFFNAGYGTEIKRNLLKNGMLKQIIIFSDEKEIFPDAVTTICVLLCKNDGKQKPIKVAQFDATVSINQITDFESFYQKEIDPTQLPCDKKWTPILQALFKEQNIPSNFIPMSSYGKFTRGIATGANDFFTLNQTKLKKLKLDNNVCKCITKSPQIKNAIFTEQDFNQLSELDKAVYCLAVTQHDDPNVQNYIKTGIEQGYHQRYLTKMRTPWYRIENRQPAPILFGVFNRGRFKVVRNFTTATNLTCFHAFYPNLFSEKIIDKIFIYLFSNIGQEILKNNKRSYGDNLDKFEPNDLNNSLCLNPDQFKNISEDDIKKIFNMIKTDEKKAIEMSDHLIQKIIY